MDSKVISTITKKVVRKFPEMSGVKPNVKLRPSPTSSAVPETFLLVYKGKGKSPAGKTIPRNVRVVVNSKGKIIKMSTSK